MTVVTDWRFGPPVTTAADRARLAAHRCAQEPGVFRRVSSSFVFDYMFNRNYEAWRALVSTVRSLDRFAGAGRSLGSARMTASERCILLLFFAEALETGDA